MLKNLRQPFIGKHLIVVKATNDALVGLQGTVVDETKFSFIIEHDGVEKRVLKRNSHFLIGDNAVSGDDVCRRPEDRMKSR